MSNQTQHFAPDGRKAACGASPIRGLGAYATDQRYTDCCRCEGTRLWKAANLKDREERAARRAAFRASPLGTAMRTVLGEGYASMPVASISEEDMDRILTLKAGIQKGGAA